LALNDLGEEIYAKPVTIDEMIFGDGWIERRGGGEATKPRPLLPEWKREPPPEPYE
jgi:hypothetical protein